MDEHTEPQHPCTGTEHLRSVIIEAIIRRLPPEKVDSIDQLVTILEDHATTRPRDHATTRPRDHATTRPFIPV